MVSHLSRYIAGLILPDYKLRGKMVSSRAADQFYRVMVQEGLHASQSRLRFYLASILGEVTFADTRVLDVGGGNGLFSFYAAQQGAQEIVCLEPESAGGVMGMNERFVHTRNQLGLGDRIRLEPIMLQDFEAPDDYFDVILLHHSINHLDESACIHLLEDERCKETYRAIFARLYALAAPGATLIACDCARENFFARLGVKNPFAPTIEWHKHQAPEVWSTLLQDVGFQESRIGWTSLAHLYEVGRILTANRLASYFFTSHFCLTMKKG